MRYSSAEALAFIYEILDWDRETCILWPFSINKTHGYGHLRNSGRITGAHRLALQMSTGLSGTGLHAAHSCRNRHCVNPNHLRWATHAGNMQDKKRDGTSNQGVRNGMSKLTEPQVLAIYSDPRTQQSIASEYDISHVTVSDIKNGKTHRHTTRHGQ